MFSQPCIHNRIPRRCLAAALACALAAWPSAAAKVPKADAEATESAPQKPSQTQRPKPGQAEAANTGTPRRAIAARPSSPPPEFRGPDVTLIASEERTVYEFRQNGQLRMIKVVPKFGKPYYLAPRDRTTGFGDLEQADSLIAEWVLWEF